MHDPGILQRSKDTLVKPDMFPESPGAAKLVTRRNDECRGLNNVKKVSEHPCYSCILYKGPG